MVFSSVLFLTLFLPIVFALYFLASNHLRNYVLFGASLFFYAWGEPKAVFLMLALIMVSYVIALQMDKCGQKHQKLWLSLGICLNLLGLVFYKYWAFLLENINFFASFMHFEPFIVPSIALPIGISFYVFQIISYLIDVYRKEVPAQSKFILLATYVSLFPQLVAGPIVRYQTIMEDLQNRKTDFENVFIGLRRFVIGLAKKVLIADQMAFVADKIFNEPIATVPQAFVWLGAVAYTIQIFYDFSGYSDMAIGLGRIFNFRFLENFDHPYSAKSIKEFWRRWHISLSSWFRDYLYIPLGGSRKGKIRTYLNGFIVFGLCGLWHGATWNFIVWGLYHGAGLTIERMGFDKVLAKLPKIIANLYVLLFVIVGWVFFRAPTLSAAKEYLKIMFLGNGSVPLNSFYTATEFLTYSNLWVLLIGILFSYPIRFSGSETFKFSRWETCGVAVLFFITFVFAVTSTFSPFIYFRF